MKKTIFKTTIAILVAVGMVTLNSCEKETTTPPTTPKSEVDENFGKFTKEVTVYDETGENSAVLKLGSNDQSILDLWTAENFSLIPITDITADNVEKPEDSSDANMDDESGNVSANVSVMMLSQNLKDGVMAVTLKTIIPNSRELRLDWFYLDYYSRQGIDKTVRYQGFNAGRRAYLTLDYMTYPNGPWITKFYDMKVTAGTNAQINIHDAYWMRAITRQKVAGEILITFLQ